MHKKLPPGTELTEEHFDATVIAAASKLDILVDAENATFTWPARRLTDQ
jgi:hypothetical protein